MYFWGHWCSTGQYSRYLKFQGPISMTILPLPFKCDRNFMWSLQILLMTQQLCAKMCSNQIIWMKLYNTEICIEFQIGVEIFSEMGPISMLWSTKEMHLECLMRWNIAIFVLCHYFNSWAPEHDCGILHISSCAKLFSFIMIWNKFVKV